MSGKQGRGCTQSCVAEAAVLVPPPLTQQTSEADPEAAARSHQL